MAKPIAAIPHRKIQRLSQCSYGLPAHPPHFMNTDSINFGMCALYAARILTHDSQAQTRDFWRSVSE
jgi:hypothetical protein